MTFFSIIIPVYNSEKYVIATIDSVLNQTFKGFEILLIDDGSTDRSADLIQNIIGEKQDPRIRFFHRPSHIAKGVSSCRNLGIEKASGEWICFLDSDDLFHPAKLAILKSRIDQSDRSVQAAFHAPLDFQDGTLVEFEKTGPADEYEIIDISEKMTNENIIYTSAACLKKEIINMTGGFDTTLAGVEDYYLWLQVSKKSKWLYLPYKLTAYRVRTGSLMGGRRMSYYIKQNHKLVKKTNANSLFTKREKKRISDYFMKNIMNYYAGISINNYGWADFFKGILMLSLAGYFPSAMKLLVKHLRFLFARSSGSLLKKIKK